MDKYSIDSTDINQARRNFLVSGLTASGSLVVGIPLPVIASSGSATSKRNRLGFFLQIEGDGRVIIGSNQPEIGQGIRTSLPMLIAEELELDWERVSVKQMPLGIVKTKDGFTWKYGGQGVGGSTGLTGSWQYMREVGAKARQLIELAAAQVWQVDVRQVYCRLGQVHHRSKSETLSYAQLVEVAASITEPASTPSLKSIDQFKIVGTQTKAVDVLDVVTGQSRFGIDTQIPNAKVAVMLRSPYLDGKVLSFDDRETLKVAGVIATTLVKGPKLGAPYHVLAEGIAVIAENTWAAMKGREKLTVKWQKGPHQNESSTSFLAQCHTLMKSKGQMVRQDGDFDEALKKSAKTISAEYFVPFVSHAPLEPQNCFAEVNEDHCKVIVPTQMPSGVSRGINSVLGIDRENIEVMMTKVGGGFGRRLTVDYAVEAALISQQSGHAIKLIWTREDDMSNDFYRPSGLHQMQAGVDSQGKVIAWKQRLASASKYYRRANVEQDKMWRAELYLDDFPAQIIPNLALEYFPVKSGVPRGSWRAPAHTANAFVIQSFIDEIAHQTGQDPLQLRLKLLGESREYDYSGHGGPKFNPGRLAKLLKFVAKKIDYTQPRAKGVGVGLACHFTFGGYAAHAIEVEVSQQGKLKILRIVGAIDCGLAVNPNAVEAQMQGGTVDGLSTALNLQITVENGQIEEKNFDQYQLARMVDIPQDFEVYIVPWDDKPTGVGEIPIPPVAPALTNAIFNATGKRIRRLPILEQLQS